MEIKLEDFKTRTGLRVLTDDGQPGLMLIRLISLSDMVTNI